MLTYSYASGDMTYIDEGHADLTGQVALMCIDSLGHQPAFGDHSSFTAASGMPEILSLLEYANRDGRYRWALDRLERCVGRRTRRAVLHGRETDASRRPHRCDRLVSAASALRAERPESAVFSAGERPVRGVVRQD